MADRQRPFHNMSANIHDLFDISGRVAVITGGAGLLGPKHAEAIIEKGGIPVLADIDVDLAKEKAEVLNQIYGVEVEAHYVDVTDKGCVADLLQAVLGKWNRLDILINNAANDPKVKSEDGGNLSRLESFSTEMWDRDLEVGLMGSFVCSQIFGSEMAARGKGIILNISSDLGIIAPDQRIYRKEGLPEEQQQVKPVTYSVIKHGVIGLTKYLATYWVDKGIRVNVLCPGGVYTEQPEEFVQKLTDLIPLGRMADVDEYKGAIQFMVSDASSYMTGSVLVVDGGRSCW